jgi:hypothetical protein
MVVHTKQLAVAERLADLTQHTSAYASIRQHTSACVSIRQHTSEVKYRGTYEQLAVAKRLADLTRLLQLIQSELREAQDEVDPRETAEPFRLAHWVELLAADPAGKRRAGAQFTCFTSAKVQNLTLLARGRSCR